MPKLVKLYVCDRDDTGTFVVTEEMEFAVPLFQKTPPPAYIIDVQGYEVQPEPVEEEWPS